MAEGKKSFVLYSDIIYTIEHLTNEEKGLLFQHLLEYVNDKKPVLEDRILIIAWKPIERQLKRDLNKYETTKEERSKSGKLGNLKKYYPDLYKRVKSDDITLKSALAIAIDRKASHSDTKLAVNDNVNDNVNDINKKETNKYPEDVFLENWAIMRKEKLNQVTNIEKLSVLESASLKMALNDYTKEQINKALYGLFNQKNLSVRSIVLRPKHFLENIPKYYDAENSKEYELYGKQKKEDAYT